MNKTFKTYAVIFIIVMIVLALLEVNKKETTDWRKNFDINEKSPFGLFVFNNEAKNLFKNNLKDGYDPQGDDQPADEQPEGDAGGKTFDRRRSGS